MPFAAELSIGFFFRLLAGACGFYRRTFPLSLSNSQLENNFPNKLFIPNFSNYFSSASSAKVLFANCLFSLFLASLFLVFPSSNVTVFHEKNFNYDNRAEEKV